MTESKKLSVFLCHSSADKAAVRDLYDLLSKHKWIEPWLDEKKLLPGQEWKTEIEKALEKADVVIVTLSKGSITKEGFIQKEFKYALDIALEKPEGAIFIIPLKLEDLESLELPRSLKALQYQDYFPKRRKAIIFETLLQSLKVRADSLGIAHEEKTIASVASKSNRDKYNKEKNAIEKGLVSTADFPIHEIPFRKNPNFTGRKDILDSIHDEFSSTQNTVPIHAIRGMGGIGKTQTAVQYSYEFAKEYDLVYWIRSETDASLTADYEALTQTLQLPVKTKAEQSVYVNIVNNWLMNTDKKWLLVFDNVESQEKIEKLLPHKGNGHILITSQSPNWKELGEDSQIKPFTNEEARDFFKRRLGGKGLEHSDRLTELMGGLPLALEQACAYMAAHGTPIEIYIRLFEEQQEELWKRETPPKDYQATIMTTWEMAFKKIQGTHPAAKQLLNLFAFFGPDDIPVSIIKTYSDNFPEELRNAVHNPIELEENLSTIYRYSLVERNGGFISFHRLVQDVIRTQLPKDITAKWVNIAVQIMKVAFPYDEYDMTSWSNCAQLLPHALAAASYAEKYNTGLEEASEIYQKAGEYLRGQAEFQRAGEAIEHAINVRQEILGAKHEKLAISFNYLGEIRLEQANHDEALRLYTRAHQIFQATESLEVQQSARNLNNLGEVFHHLDEFEKAKNYYEQALAIYKNTLKNDRPDISMCLNNLGVLFGQQGEFEEARKYHEDALSIRKKILGENHPHVAMSLSNLGILLSDQGELEVARKYFEQARAISIMALGGNHPDTATRLNNLGTVIADQGEYEVAQKYFEQANTIGVTALGESHPSVAVTLNNIGAMFSKQSKHIEARRYLEQALSIDEKVYGVKHHTLIRTLSALATVMFHLRLFPLARQYADRASKICSEAKVKYIECEDLGRLTKSIPSIGKKVEKKKKHK